MKVYALLSIKIVGNEYVSYEIEFLEKICATIEAAQNEKKSLPNKKTKTIIREFELKQ